MGVCGPTHDERSWTFDLDPGGRDPVLGIERLQEAFLARFPDYPKGITVPAIVDVPTGQGRHQRLPADHARPLDGVDRAPPRRRARPLPRARCATRSTRSTTWVYTDVNNGVYRCGFAGRQASYERAYDRLFAALDRLEERLTDRRYLVGDQITEADVRLFTTLVRFDPVYHGHFKANRNKLVEMPALWGYARDLFQTPGFGDTVDFEHIKQHYYVVHTRHQPDAGRARRARTWRLADRRTAARSSAAARSATARPPAPPRDEEIVPGGAPRRLTAAPGGRGPVPRLGRFATHLALPASTFAVCKETEG